MDQITTKIFVSTLRKAKVLAVLKGISMAKLLDTLVNAEFAKLPEDVQKMTEENKTP